MARLLNLRLSAVCTTLIFVGAACVLGAQAQEAAPGPGAVLSRRSEKAKPAASVRRSIQLFLIDHRARALRRGWR